MTRGAALKGTIPVHQQWDIYGRLGWTTIVPSWIQASTRIVHSLVQCIEWMERRREPFRRAARVGVEWKPQKNWGIRAEYENYGAFGNKLDSYGKTGAPMSTCGRLVLSSASNRIAPSGKGGLRPAFLFAYSGSALLANC